MLKDTKSLGNNKAPLAAIKIYVACESRGFVLNWIIHKKKVRITSVITQVILI